MRHEIIRAAGKAKHFCLAAFFIFVLPLPAAIAVEVERVTSPGGIEAWLVRDNTIPITSMEFSFRGAGAAADPAALPGLAEMTSSLLDEGAGEFESQAYQAQLEDNAIRLSFSAGQETFRGSFKTLNIHRDKAVELLRLALTEPRFDISAVERIRRQIVINLRQRSTDPNYRAGRIYNQAVYPNHPFSKPAGGTVASIEKISVQDMRDFVKQRFSRSNLIVGVVGDITPQDLGKMLDNAFGGLAETADVAVVPAVESAAAGETFVAEMDIPQSVVVFGQSGIRRDDPDYYTAYVLNYVLGGGGFSSRLYSEVREKRGLVYSVYSYLHPRRQGPEVSGGFATRNAQVGTALDIVRKEWRRIGEEGISAEELASAKKFVNGAFPLRLSSTSRIARRLVGMQYYDLGIDFIERRKDFIDKIEMSDVKRVAKRLYRPENLTVVIVGKPEGVKPTAATPDVDS